MGFIEWFREKTSSQAKLNRLEREVEREEAKAAFAKAQLPLLIRKDQAQAIIDKRDACKKVIRDKRMAKFKTVLGKMNDNLKKNNDKSSFGNLKLKTPSDSLYKT